MRRLVSPIVKLWQSAGCLPARPQICHLTTLSSQRPQSSNWKHFCHDNIWPYQFPTLKKQPSLREKTTGSEENSGPERVKGVPACTSARRKNQSWANHFFSETGGKSRFQPQGEKSLFQTWRLEAGWNWRAVRPGKAVDLVEGGVHYRPGAAG